MYDMCGHKLAYLEDKRPGVQLLGHMISVCSLLKKLLNTFSTGVVPFNPFHQQGVRDPVFPHLCQHFVLLQFLISVV